jgi:predicted nucleotidyltransferase component of viral defense system
MQTFLSLTPEEQKLAIEQTAARKGWAAPSVEKDFWVCWVLRALFTMPDLAPHLTFKGGTSLSKVWNLIDRFSEDIDLTIDRAALGFGGTDSPDQATSAKQRQKRLKSLKEACRDYVQSRVMPQLAEKMAADISENWTLKPDDNDPDGQTLLFEYPTYFGSQQHRYVRPVVKVELGARSDPWPAHKRKVRPYIAEAFPQAFSAPDCEVIALAPERTFWEKAMLLHEETYRPPEKLRRPRMARHYYDLYQLIRHGIAARAIADKNLFEQVANHRRVFFPHNWVDYDTLRPGSFRMLPLPEQHAGWRDDYAAMRGEMFSTEPPTFDTLLDAISAIEDEINANATDK